MNARKLNRCRRRGAVTVESALVLPIVLLFLFGIMEYGRFIMLQQVVTNAAREGCRYALTHITPVTISGVTAGNNTSDVTTVINNRMAGLSLSGQAVQIYCSDTLGNNQGAWTTAQAGQSICVQITGNYVPIVGRFLYMPVSIPVKAQAVMRVESG